MLQIAIIEDEADLAQQTKDNVVRYLNEHGLEGNCFDFLQYYFSPSAWIGNQRISPGNGICLLGNDYRIIFWM